MLKKIRLKIAIVGPPQSGKTSFINNLLDKKFDPNYRKTQQYQLSLYKFATNKAQYEIQLWQCGAQHKQYNKHIRQAFFKNCSAAFLIFDLSDEKWKQKVQQWLSQAYQFDCFLVYAVGTKKDVWTRRKYVSVHGSQNVPQQKLTDSLLQTHGVQTLDELQINKFFEQFQVKHFYQQANQPIHRSIRNIFITIQNDQQKLTRSSLAVARKFDNSLVDYKSEIKAGESTRFQMLIQSVKFQQFQPKWKNRGDKQEKNI